MRKLNIVGVSGQAGSGKDTIANYLVEKYSFVKIALADPIKRFGYYVFLFNSDQLWGPSSSRNAIDQRYAHSDAWDSAQGRLAAYSRVYITDILGSDDVDEISEAYNSLIRWFWWLRDNYQGNLSPRVMLQTLGTEWGRNSVNLDIWINYLLRTSRTLLHEDGNTKQWSYDALEGCIDGARTSKDCKSACGIVISDIRFENEFKRIREAGGTVIRVIRPATDVGASTVGIAGHSSESHYYSLDNFDFILNNEGTVSDLHWAIDTYMPVLNIE